MARTPGALNKRTRAALEAAKECQLDSNGLSSPVRYMLRIVADSRKEESVRLEAAKAAAPYLQPKLSAVELNQTNPDDVLKDDDLLERMKHLVETDPGLRQQFAALLGYQSSESAK
jgi:hypothetical protein